MPRAVASPPLKQRWSRKPATELDPLPVVLLRHGPVSIRGLSALRDDRRFELVVVDQLSPEWTSLARRVAGTIVATDCDPMSALVYALSGGISGPIVMMFAKRYRTDCKDLIAAGAAACFTIPVRPKDLDNVAALFGSNSSLARVDRTLRLLFDPIAMTVRFHDKCVRLSQREFAVLQFMSTFGGQPVAAHKLMAHVWGNHVAGDRPRQILDVYIFQLRRKLDRLGLKATITTVRGVGYALVAAPVEHTTH